MKAELYNKELISDIKHFTILTSTAPKRIKQSQNPKFYFPFSSYSYSISFLFKFSLFFVIVFLSNQFTCAQFWKLWIYNVPLLCDRTKEVFNFMQIISNSSILGEKRKKFVHHPNHTDFISFKLKGLFYLFLLVSAVQSQKDSQYWALTNAENNRHLDCRKFHYWAFSSVCPLYQRRSLHCG